MSVSARTKRVMAQGLGTPAMNELVSILNVAPGAVASKVAALTVSATTGTLATPDGSVTFVDVTSQGTLAISATTGSLPVAASTQTIANAASPTVAELLATCVSLTTKYNKTSATVDSLVESVVELKKKLNDLLSSLTTAGVMSSS